MRAAPRILLALGTLGLPSTAIGQAPVTQPIPRAQFIAQMDSQFRSMDADKNGQLTRAEIEQHQNQSTLADAKARNRALFGQLDADKSGFISPAEFAKLTASPAPANGQAMVAREDRNRDNQVSLIEHRAATLANFDRLDTDKDGIVTAAEMKAAGIAR